MVKVVFDTSVLLASTLSYHPLHSKCVPYLQDVCSGKDQGFLCTHTLAEYFRFLTSKARPVQTSNAAKIVIDQLGQDFNIISLSEQDFLTVFAAMAKLKLSGPVVYDALIVQAALIARADYVLTLNGRDFDRLGEGMGVPVIVLV